MAQLTSMNQLQINGMVNAATIKYGSIEAFLRSDEYDVIFPYLAGKMKKHRESGNIDKLIVYYRYTISKPFDKAPQYVKDEVKEVRAILRKVLMLY